MKTNDSKSPDFAGPCPRCGGGVPNDRMPGAYPGALSRFDNETYVCSSCGTVEAVRGGHVVPFDVDLNSDKAYELHDFDRQFGMQA